MSIFLTFLLLANPNQPKTPVDVKEVHAEIMHFTNEAIENFNKKDFIQDNKPRWQELHNKAQKIEMPKPRKIKMPKKFRKPSYRQLRQEIHNFDIILEAIMKEHNNPIAAG